MLRSLCYFTLYRFTRDDFDKDLESCDSVNLSSGRNCEVIHFVSNKLKFTKKRGGGIMVKYFMLCSAYQNYITTKKKGPFFVKKLRIK